MDNSAEELIIDFKEVIGDHGGENIAEVVWGTLTLYNIQDQVRVFRLILYCLLNTPKVICFVMDMRRNNDTMLRSIEARCHQAGIVFSAQDARGRCMPHTIHLAASAGKSLNAF